MPNSGEVKKDSQVDFTVIKVKEEKPDLREKEKPLVDLKVTNPITYIKSWWKKIIGNEGIELKIKAKPLTVIAMTLVIVTVSMGIGRFVFPFKIPYFEYTTINEIAPPPTSPTVVTVKEPRDTAFAGVLKFDTPKNKFYLFTATSEAINLSVPENIDLTEFTGRRIYAAGKYDEDMRTLLVESASDMEVLPTKFVPIPTLTSFPEETPIPSL